MRREPSCWSEIFDNSWLYVSPNRLNESPQRLNQPSLYNQLVSNINDFIKAAPEFIVDLGNGWMKFQGKTTFIYWHQNESEITIGIELNLQSDTLVVNFVAKNPMYQGKSPFASDLYDMILKDQKHSKIRLSSDQKLSDDWFNIWAKLLSLGHKIHVYNKKEPGQTFHEITDLDDLKNFFGDDDTYHDYQYILTETVIASIETKHTFELRRIRELSGYGFNADGTVEYI